MSADQLFADVIGVAVVQNALFSDTHTLHPYELKQKMFSAQLEPDCLLLDGDSFENESDLVRVFGLIEKYLPDSNVIVFCESESWRFLAKAIQFGTRGIVLKSQGVADIEQVVESVRDGNASCPAGVTAATLNEIRRLAMQKAGEASSGCHLTKREIEVLEFVARDMANKEISKELGLSISTIKNHLHNIFEKLECHSRKTAVRHAIAHGFLQCSKDKVFA